MKTFANVPSVIEETIQKLLNNEDSSEWVQKAVKLHELYVSRDKAHGRISIKSYEDTLAYLAMRSPATYAQIFHAFDAIHDILPNWQPTSLLDIGSAQGSGIWAAQEVWPSIVEATAVDQQEDFLLLGKKIQKQANLSMDIKWQHRDIREGVNNAKEYDVVVIANVLNELSPKAADKIVGQALEACKGVLVIVEPGTPFGSSITQNVARKLGQAGNLIAPYVQNSFVDTGEYYLHFPQRFIRPDFQRRVRQHMRSTALMASDWEEAKLAYSVISRLPAEKTPWARVAGPIRQQKGFVEIPALTDKKIETVKVLKRNTEQYSIAKDLVWGQALIEPLTLPNEPQ
jgi:ribosomal protein RSM22 (predicted rRNA methylase)